MMNSRELFQEQIAAYGTKDIERLLKSFAPHAVLQDMAAPEQPYEGHERIAEFLTEYFSHLENVRAEIVSLAVDGNVALGELEVHATYLVDPANPGESHEVVMRYCLADRIEDGKIVLERFYWDQSEFENQLSNASRSGSHAAAESALPA